MVTAFTMGEAYMAVGGDLRDMDVSSIISINCNQMNQARLLVRHQGREASIFFQDGNIVHMSLESEEGEGVINEVLAWREGTFQLEQGILAPRRTVTASWSELVLKGMQHADQRSALGVDDALAAESQDGVPSEIELKREITEPSTETLQAVLNEFAGRATQVVACSVSSIPDGEVLAGYPGLEASVAAAPSLARALREMEEAAGQMNWGAVDTLAMVTDSFDLSMFVIAAGRAYVAVAVPHAVTQTDIRAIFDEYRSRLDEAML